MSLSVFIFLIGFAQTAFSDEGFWPISKLVSFEKTAPRSNIQSEDALSENFIKAFPKIADGCSSALVSKDGLLITNYHCLLSCFDSPQANGLNIKKLGFSAEKKESELSCPSTSVEILTSFRNVSKELAGSAFSDFKLKNNGKKIINFFDRECESSDQLKRKCYLYSDPATSETFLSVYRKYDDLRLVFAPESELAFWGGVSNVFTFPSFKSDYVFARVYEAGVPILSPSHISLTQAGVENFQELLVVGFPGKSERNLSFQHFEFLSKVKWPLDLSYQKNAISFYENFIKVSTADEVSLIGVDTDLFIAKNSETVLDAKSKLVAKTPFIQNLKRLQKQTLSEKDRASMGDLNSSLEEIYKKHSRTELAYQHIERLFSDSPALASARKMQSLSIQNKSLTQNELKKLFILEFEKYRSLVADERRLNYEKKKFENGFLWFLENMDKADPALKIQYFKDLSKGRAEKKRLAQRLKNESIFFKSQKMLDSNSIDFTHDSLYKLVETLEAAKAELSKERSEKFTTPLKSAHYNLFLDLVARGHKKAYPDADGSLRYIEGSFSKADSSSCSHKKSLCKTDAYTTIGDFKKILLRRKTDSAAIKKWRANLHLFSENIKVNMLTNHDAVGGLSGAPLLNKNKQILGLVFDGNSFSRTNELLYNPTRSKTISVSSEFILESIKHVYKNEALLRELENVTK